MQDDKKVQSEDEKAKPVEGAITEAELSDEALTEVSGGFSWDRAIKRAKEDRWFPAF